MRGLVIAVTVMLAGCGDRRTFDQRYDDTSAELENKARQLDRNLEGAVQQNTGDARKSW